MPAVAKESRTEPTNSAKAAKTSLTTPRRSGYVRIWLRARDAVSHALLQVCSHDKFVEQEDL